MIVQVPVSATKSVTMDLPVPLSDTEWAVLVTVMTALGGVDDDIDLLRKQRQRQKVI